MARTKTLDPLTKILLQSLVGLVAFFGLFFTIAGDWGWMRGWAYFAVVIGGTAISDFILWKKNPELLHRRATYGEGSKDWDKRLIMAFALALMLAILVGALDAGRHHWSGMSAWLWPVGLALYVVGQSIAAWAAIINPFFEKTARIQTDRDHQVIDSGPYRFVRHPGYLGSIVGLVLSTPLLLGSWVAFLPASAAVIVFIVRTALEDRMLMEELDGYRAYSNRVRFRLIPLIW